MKWERRGEKMCSWNVAKSGDDSFFISPAELQVFMQHYTQKYPKADVSHGKILQIARLAITASTMGKFTLDQLRAFKKIELELLGEQWAVAETFKHQMGIPSKELVSKGELQFDREAQKGLLAVWGGKKDSEIVEQFLSLDPYKQKLILKTCSHFSWSLQPLTKPEFSEHDLAILHSLRNELQKEFGSSGELPRDTRTKSEKYFALFHPAFYGVDVDALEKPKLPSNAIKRELFLIGEKRIGGDLKNDFQHLMGAYPDLRTRYDQKDTSAYSDAEQFSLKCQTAITKATTLVKLYHHYSEDADIKFLEAKAQYHLSALQTMQKGHSAFNEEFFTQLSKNTSPKAAILASKFARQYPITEKNFKELVQGLEKSTAWGDQEAELELAKLYISAWKSKIPNVDEITILDYLKPMGKAGASALQEFFSAGSLKAGEQLIQLMDKRLEPESLKAKIQSVWNSILHWFFGSATLYGERPFFAKDPRRLSSNEIDFLIAASFLDVHGAEKVLKNLLEGDFGPKIPLEQAHAFISSVKSKRVSEITDQDPYMIINRKEAFRHLEGVEKIAALMGKKLPFLADYEKRSI